MLPVLSHVEVMSHFAFPTVHVQMLNAQPVVPVMTSALTGVHVTGIKCKFVPSLKTCHNPHQVNSVANIAPSLNAQSFMLTRTNDAFIKPRGCSLSVRICAVISI